MHILMTGRGLYFCGKTRDFRRFLAALAERPQTLAAYLRQNLS
jgi:hypothetical protein